MSFHIAENYYQQHCTQHKATIFKLLGDFEVLLASCQMADTVGLPYLQGLTHRYSIISV